MASTQTNVGKLLAGTALLTAAVMVGRCWGQNSQQAASTNAPNSAAVPNAATTVEAEPAVQLHLDAGGLTLLPDASLSVPPMPSLDQERMLRGQPQQPAQGGAEP